MRLLILLLLLALPAAAQSPAPTDPEVARLLGTGWTFFEQGAMVKAQEQFEQALSLRAGRGIAEAHYAMAAVWWERRNALASYNRLQEARQLQANEPWAWDGGEGGVWDRRIDGRIRWIERNFTVIKLVLPGPKPLPPLATPPPVDPLLLEFVDAVDREVLASHEADVDRLWMLLPRGTWWVNGEEHTLDSGEMAPHRARTWELVPDRMGARKKYDARKAGEVEAPVPTPTPTAAVDGAEPAVAARVLQPFARRYITADKLVELNEALSRHGFEGPFKMRFGCTVPDRETVLRLRWLDAGFDVQVDGAGTLEVRGADKTTEHLGADWYVGPGAGINLIELEFDGHKLHVSVNGVDLRPTTVFRGEALSLGAWSVDVTHPGADLQHFWVEPTAP